MPHDILGTFHQLWATTNLEPGRDRELLKSRLYGGSGGGISSGEFFGWQNGANLYMDIIRLKNIYKIVHGNFCIKTRKSRERLEM